MNYSKLAILVLMILSTSCGSITLDTDIDDAVDSLLEAAEQAIEGSELFTDEFEDVATTDDEAIEDATGTTFLATYDVLGDTCEDHSFPDNVRLFSGQDTIELYRMNDELFIEGQIREDETITFTTEFDGLILQSDQLSCVCTVEAGNELQCSCENDDVDCSILYGQL